MSGKPDSRLADSRYSHEILEVVDSEDRVIGTERRGIIHERGLMHRSAQVLLFNAAGELFLQKRSMGKDEFPGLWDSSAAGHVNPGESYHSCALRELEEELGIGLDGPLTRLFKIPASKNTGYEHCTVFSCVSDRPLTLQPEEVDEGRWLGPDEMDHWVTQRQDRLTPAIRRIWYRFRHGSN
jgi:isopentenyl-diphosphate delta-isomerase type 1